MPAEISDTPDYTSFDVHLEAMVAGDLDGDGKPDTVVLLQCMPQPSNAFVEEVQVFRPAGSLMGELPSPRTLPETTILAPLYVPAGLSVQNWVVVAAMKEYGPNDSHATGPSCPTRCPAPVGRRGAPPPGQLPAGPAQSPRVLRGLPPAPRCAVPDQV